MGFVDCMFQCSCDPLLYAASVRVRRLSSVHIVDQRHRSRCNDNDLLAFPRVTFAINLSPCVRYCFWLLAFFSFSFFFFFFLLYVCVGGGGGAYLLIYIQIHAVSFLFVALSNCCWVLLVLLLCVWGGWVCCCCCCFLVLLLLLLSAGLSKS